MIARLSNGGGAVWEARKRERVEEEGVQRSAGACQSAAEADPCPPRQRRAAKVAQRGSNRWGGGSAGGEAGKRELTRARHAAAAARTARRGAGGAKKTATYRKLRPVTTSKSELTTVVALPRMVDMETVIESRPATAP